MRNEDELVKKEQEGRKGVRKTGERVKLAIDKPAAVTSSHLASNGCGGAKRILQDDGINHTYIYRHEESEGRGLRDKEYGRREAIKDKTGKGKRSKGKRQH